MTKRRFFTNYKTLKNNLNYKSNPIHIINPLILLVIVPKNPKIENHGHWPKPSFTSNSSNKTNKSSNFPLKNKNKKYSIKCLLYTKIVTLVNVNHIIKKWSPGFVLFKILLSFIKIKVLMSWRVFIIRRRVRGWVVVRSIKNEQNNIKYQTYNKN